MLAVLGGCAHAAPRGGSPGDVTVLDAGASPRRALHYGDTAGLEHAVALTWRGSSRSSGGSCVGGWNTTMVVFDGVALTGTLAGEQAGRLVLAFDGGTTTLHESEFFQRGAADLSELMPTRFALIAHRGHVGLAIGGEERYGDGLASELPQLVVAAMPRLPAHAIGVGARWESTSVHGLVTRRTTWHLVAVTASRITVDGTIVESTRPVGDAGFGPWGKTITVRGDVDLDSLALRAEIVRSTSRGGDSSASSTTSLAIAPR